MARCEDYPCCGHTDLDPCERQWYDEPDAFDISKNPHALCEHEAGICEVWEDEYDDDLYGDIDACKEAGQHLHDTDKDGYCCRCGEGPDGDE